MLPCKGNQERPHIIRVHGQFGENQEVDCLVVVTGHAAMCVPQSPHLIDALKCCGQMRAMPESKSRIATQVRSGGVVKVVFFVRNHRLYNPNTEWPRKINGKLRSERNMCRLLQEKCSAVGSIFRVECAQTVRNRCPGHI